MIWNFNFSFEMNVLIKFILYFAYYEPEFEAEVFKVSQKVRLIKNFFQTV